MRNDNNDRQNEQPNNENTNGDGLNNPSDARIHEDSNHEGDPDDGEDAEAIGQIASEQLAGYNWEGEIIPVDAIQASRSQVRTDFDTEKLEQLGRTIREHGLINPITVRPANPDDDADVEIAYPHTHLVFDETSGRARITVEGPEDLEGRSSSTGRGTAD